MHYFNRKSEDNQQIELLLTIKQNDVNTVT